MRMWTWAILGSLVINLMLGATVAALFSVSPPAQAVEASACPTPLPTQARQTPAQSTRSRPRYIVAVRMGWAMG